MPKLSCFTPCGALRFSNAPSHIEEMYNALPTLWGSQYDVDEVGTYDEAKRYAIARVLGGVAFWIDGVKAEIRPSTSYDLLPLHELDNLMTPGPADNVPTRQAALAAALQLPRGSTAANMVNFLRSIMGADFLAYVPGPGGASSVVVPSSPGAGPGAFRDVRIPPRIVQLVDPVARPFSVFNSPPSPPVYIGIPTWCAYQNLDPTNTTATKLLKGDTVVVDGGNTSRMEQVIVTDVADDAPIGSNATPGYPCFLATYSNPHDIGVPVTTGNAPYWWSTRRLTLFVMTLARALDRPTRARVDAALAKLTKGTETWALVAPTTTTTTGGTIGPFKVGAPMGTSTLAAITYTNSL